MGQTRAALDPSDPPNSISAVENASAANLRLGEHVQTPGAHLAVSGNADQVVSVLGSDDVHAVDRVLNEVNKTLNKSGSDLKRQREMRCSPLPCAPTRTGEFFEQACVCCSCCPTGLSVRNKSRPPPG